MVDFEDEDDINTLFVEDNPQTSGNGKFLETLDVNYINYQDKQRCDDQLEFLIDKPPHHHEYFHLQLQAVQNYYNAIYTSNLSNVFEIDMICNDLDNSNSCDNNDEFYHLSEKMDYYTPTDDKIGLLFSDALELAKNDIQDYVNSNNLDYENILFVVFHAGLGQEASQEFDPTPYDIKSAYVDDNMLDDVPSNAWINSVLYDANNDFIGGVVMPETLNWIYYDVIEDIFPIDLVSYNNLDNYYCEIQLGMTGLFSYLMGYHFGFQPMHNTENGDTRVGLFGLMDVGFYNMNGIIPSRPVPWTRSSRGLSSNITNITENVLTSSPIPSISRVNSNTDQILKINISNYEYFLFEHRSNKLDNGMSIQEIIDVDYPGSPNYDENNDEYKNIFDVINSNNGNIASNFSFDPTYHVITSVDNYDYGIPGEGLLIWHIDELNYNYSNLNPQGINNDIDNRTVALEEGDGVSNIGNPNYLWFNDNTSGWLYDFWTDDNQLYLDVNYGINNWGANADVIFNSNSIPNSNTNDDANSSLSVVVTGSSTLYSNITADFESPFPVQDLTNDLLFIENDVSVIGNDGYESFFYNKNNQIYKVAANRVCSDDLTTHCSCNSCYGDCSDGLLTFPDVCLNNNDCNVYEGICIGAPYCNNSGICIGGTNDLNACLNVSDCPGYGECNGGAYDGDLCLTNNDCGEFSCGPIPSCVFDSYLFDCSNEPNCTSLIGSNINDDTRIKFVDPDYFLVDINDYLDGGSQHVDVQGYYEMLPPNLSFISNALALGDLDMDGYDEKIIINNGNLEVYSFSGDSDVSVNGFPVYGNFYGFPLVSDVDNDLKPEIICKNGSKVSVISNEGFILYEIPLSNIESDLSILPYDGNSKSLLLNGDIGIEFCDYNEDYSFWNNSFSQVSFNSIVTGQHIVQNLNNTVGIDMSKTYNYPNPIENNYTKFRFFVNTSQSVNIKIYDVAGFLVAELNDNSLIQNEYNEIVWTTKSMESGLYFATIKSDKGESKLIKVVIL